MSATRGNLLTRVFAVIKYYPRINFLHKQIEQIADACNISSTNHIPVSLCTANKIYV